MLALVTLEVRTLNHDAPASAASPALQLGGFHLAWIACVGLAARGRPELGCLVMLLFCAAFLACSRTRRSDLERAFGAAAIGYLGDSALVWAELVSFPEATRLGGPSPLWMVSLWLGFGLIVRDGFSWLSGRPARAALLGALAAPLSYLGGARLGAMTIPSSGTAATLAIAGEWALAMPALLALSAARSSGRAEERGAGQA